jgi:hypothetical protein
MFRLDKELVLCRGTAIGSNINGLRDTEMDFIAAGIQVGDLIRNLTTGITSSITTVLISSLGCLPISDNQDYEIIDTTLSGLSARSSFSDNSYKIQSILQSVDVNGVQWLQASSQQPELGSVVSITSASENKRIFQCLGVTPVFNSIGGDDKFECQIFGSNWDDRFFDYSDTVLTSHKGFKFGGTI